MAFVGEYWQFIRTRKKYWLIPILITAFFLGAVIIYTSGTVVAPFIYTLF